MIGLKRLALLKHGAPPRNVLEAALRAKWGGGGASYEKTVGPAPILSISDAKAKPAKSLIVGMEPIQDLHGYDSPWPAGGGKNLFNPSIATAGYLNNSGVAQPQSTTYYEYYSDYIPINGNTVSIGYFGYASEDSAWSAVAWYDSDKNFLSRSNTSTNPNTLSVPENASYAIAMMRTYNHGLDKCYFAYGNDLTYAPYSNICPISGRTGVTAYRTGVNVWDEEVSVVGSHINSKNNIPVLPNTEYAWVSPVQPANGFRFLDVDGKTISTVYSINTGKFTTPANCYYVWFGLASYYGTTYNHDISINYPATDTDYHAYNGNTYPVTWQDSVGTVYGGTVDLVSGLLTVTHAIVDLAGTDGWYSFAVGTSSASAIMSLPAEAYLPSSLSGYNNAISSIGLENPRYWASARPNETPDNGNWSFAIGGSFVRFHTTDIDTVSDLASFKAAFPGAQICYNLATPQTYQLTPQQIALLKGANTLWSDADNLTLTYIGTEPEE